MYRKIIVFSLSSLLFSLTLWPQRSEAIYGGEEVFGSERVVAIMGSKDSRISGCTGALITSRIVLTAAHCLGKSGNFPGQLSQDPSGWWVTQPGVNVKLDDIATRVQVIYVVIKDDYTNIYDPAKNNRLTQRDDIGFLFLDKGIELAMYPQIATEEDVSRLKANSGIITHFGYGFVEEGIYTGMPKKVNLRIRPRKYSYDFEYGALEKNSIITDETGTLALCPGDSGGPWYAELDGKLLIVANHVAASGCRGSGSGRGGTLGTLIYPYEKLLWSKWDYFLINEKQIRGIDTKVVEEVPVEKGKSDTDVGPIISSKDQSPTNKEPISAEKDLVKVKIKELTIICVKGKSSLKVIGKKPICPKGYKKKL